MSPIKNILLFLFAGSQLSTMAGQEKVVLLRLAIWINGLS